MRRLLVTFVSLSLALGGLPWIASARDIVPGGISTNADGSYVTSTAGVNPTANGGGGTVIYGDITTGPGYTVVGPPSVTHGPAAPAPAEAAPEPASDAAPVEPAAAEGAVATATDLDTDNLADDLEWDLGLDPNNADTDSDEVADGDELTIYSTDPLNGDSDGDGISDGEELFGSMTDPLVWEDSSIEHVESLAQEAAEAPQPSSSQSAAATRPQGTTESLTATDGDAAVRGSGNASAAPGTVTRDGHTSGGAALLGPDGTYKVSENAPANVSVSGDTDVISPPVSTTAEPAAPDASGNVPACDWYGSWYDAQVAYENAGMTSADPALVASLDPDYDGIACEEGMA